MSTPEPPEGRVEAELPGYRFGIVLALLFVTFVFMASGPTGSWAVFVAVVLQGATLLAAFKAAQVGPRLWRVALVVVLVALLSALAVWLSGTEVRTGVLFALSVLLVAAAPVAIAYRLYVRHVIDIKTVMGALCIYVLLGMFWAYLFGTIDALSTSSFFVQTSKPNLADFLYFSFVTLTTTGYGDYTAANGLGRAVAILEALLGQMYLVTVVALLVSNLGGRARRRVDGDD